METHGNGHTLSIGVGADWLWYLYLAKPGQMIDTPLVPKKSANQKALRKVEAVTDSEPVKGEDLLRSKKLKRKLASAKKRIVKK